MEKKIRINWITIVCALAVMSAAVFVRLPAARLSGLSDEQREAYTTESGVPYLTDPDSYYHTRITDNGIEYSALSSTQTEEGILWDTQSNFPEGRSAEYQPGIVYVTEAVWRLASVLFRADLYTVEFWLPSVMAALAALAAFFLGNRISGRAGGITAGILVSCASSFVARALPGRFDTDMFIAVMDVLLILFMTEAFRAETFGKCLAAAACFALTVVGFTWCWSVYAFMFSALTVCGGAVFLIVHAVMCRRDSTVDPAGRYRAGTAVRTWLLCAGMMTILLLLINGPSFFIQFFHRVSWAGSMTESGALPNLLASVTELDRPAFASSDPAEWFVAFVPGKRLTVLNGIGGAAVAVLCLGGIILLIIRGAAAPRKRTPEKQDTADVCMTEEIKEKSDKETAVLYGCVLFTWMLGSLYASRQGIRFVEHLAVPAGILAGSCVGWITPKNISLRTGKGIAKLFLTVCICAAAVALPVSGAVQICRQNRPSVSDSLRDGMAWIRDNAENSDAVIASWWDLGYFYEYASGHPAFWDGGSQSGLRAVLIAKVLTSRDPELSEAILQMMAASGNQPVNELIRLLGEKRAFSALWEVLLADSEETEQYLTEEYGVPAETAELLAGMIHPDQKQEVYLVISGDMLYKLGWIEYYADWDFTGDQRPPAATVYSVMPDASENIHSDNENARAFFADRAQETIWRLFFNAEGGEYFEPVFEASDGVSQIQVWKVA